MRARGARRDRRRPAVRHVLVCLMLLALAACSGTAAPQAATATPRTSPQTSRPAGRAWSVPLENARPGTRAWRIAGRSPLRGPSVEGFADRVSVTPGASVGLHVFTRAKAWTVTAYRIGWYSGLGGRRVWGAGPQPGRTQPPPVLVQTTRTVVARWSRSLTVPTSGWPPGQYLLVLAAAGGGRSYVPLLVRSPSTAGRLVLVSSTMTWQAYNSWGGYSLYAGPGARGVPSYGTRSLAVSFDRPYGAEAGAGLLFAFEEPLLAAAERLGLPLAYETDVDLATHPGLLDGARAVVFGGHSEYWTTALRAEVERAREAGTNLAFLGANTAYWRVRLEPAGGSADRLVVGYKTAPDPAAAAHPALTTTRFRDPPAARPEATLVGLQYECFPVEAAYRVFDPSFWLFAGTHVARGAGLPGLVGVEIDRFHPLPGVPRPVQVVAHSPVWCGGVPTWQDSVYYTVPSGAAVLAVGTMRWVCALGGGCADHGVDAVTTAFVTTVTDRMLRAFASGPAGRDHPARDDFVSYAARPRPDTTGGA